MRDGVKLFAVIYEPKDKDKKYPIMFDRTPYSVAPYGPKEFKTLLGPSELFAREGYIFVYQDVRGRYMSEGDYEDVRPYIHNKTGKQFDETTDAYDTVEWLIKNVPNNNGRVGVWGISYPGFYSFDGGYRWSSRGQSHLAAGADRRLVPWRRHESQWRAVSRAELRLLCVHGPGAPVADRHERLRKASIRGARRTATNSFSKWAGSENPVICFGRSWAFDRSSGTSCSCIPTMISFGKSETSFPI